MFFVVVGFSSSTLCLASWSFRLSYLFISFLCQDVCEVRPTIWIQPDLSCGFLVTVSAASSAWRKPSFFLAVSGHWGHHFVSEVLTRVPFLRDMSEPSTRRFVSNSKSTSFRRRFPKFSEVSLVLFRSFRTWNLINHGKNAQNFIDLLVLVAQFKAALGYDNWICAQDGNKWKNKGWMGGNNWKERGMDLWWFMCIICKFISDIFIHIYITCIIAYYCTGVHCMLYVSLLKHCRLCRKGYTGTSRLDCGSAGKCQEGFRVIRVMRVIRNEIRIEEQSRKNL